MMSSGALHHSHHTLPLLRLLAQLALAPPQCRIIQNLSYHQCQLSRIKLEEISRSLPSLRRRRTAPQVPPQGCFVRFPTIPPEAAAHVETIWEKPRELAVHQALAALVTR